MRNYLKHRYGKDAAPAHVWCGVSVEDHRAVTRIKHLQDAPAKVRFLSFEPLLGSVGEIDLRGISWVIVGGESGPKARPMKQGWVQEIKDVCERERIDFFFKQWGGLTPKTGGRKLNGIEYNAMPISLTWEENNVIRLEA